MRTLRKVALAAIIMMIVAAGVYAESYAGFEVKYGFGEVEVIEIELHNVYITRTPEDITFEVPLIFYKAIEKELSVIDKYMSINDEEIRKDDFSSFKNAYYNLGQIIQLKGYFDDGDMQEIQKWTKAINTSMTEYGNICKGMFSLFFMMEFGPVINSIEQFLGRVAYNGFSSAELSEQICKDERSKIYFLHVLEAFPAIEFKNLGLKL